MIAWLILLILAGASGLFLRLLGVRGGLLTAAGAALLVGAAGYALQGDPSVPTAPARGREAAQPFPLTEARHAFFGEFAASEGWMRISEALARTGNTKDAVGILTNATERYPGDPQLWIGLGNALVDHAHMITPPAEFAYRRASEVAPGKPAGPFFYGLALARSGQPEAAVAIWQSILATAPPNASWRPLVEQGVAALKPPPKPQAATGS